MTNDNKISKTCKIHGELITANIKTGIYKGKTYIKCRLCEIDRSRKYHEKKYADPLWVEKKHEYDNNYWKENKEKITKRRQKELPLKKRRDSYQRKKDEYQSKCRSKQRKYRAELHDAYIRKIIHNGDKNVPISSIPDDLVKLKRLNILIKRKIKEIKGEHGKQ